jgi:hypothetical protein
MPEGPEKARLWAEECQRRTAWDKSFDDNTERLDTEPTNVSETKSKRNNRRFVLG